MKQTKIEKRAAGGAADRNVVGLGAVRILWGNEGARTLFFRPKETKKNKNRPKQDKFVRFWFLNAEILRKSLMFKRLEEKKEYTFFLSRQNVLSSPFEFVSHDHLLEIPCDGCS